MPKTAPRISREQIRRIAMRLIENWPEWEQEANQHAVAGQDDMIGVHEMLVRIEEAIEEELCP